MHTDFDRSARWSKKAIGAAMEVHRNKGPGFIESIYEKCMMHECQLQGIPAKNQVDVSIEYKGLVF